MCLPALLLALGLGPVPAAWAMIDAPISVMRTLEAPVGSSSWISTLRPRASFAHFVRGIGAHYRVALRGDEESKAATPWRHVQAWRQRQGFAVAAVALAPELIPYTPEQARVAEVLEDLRLAQPSTDGMVPTAPGVPTGANLPTAGAMPGAAMAPAIEGNAPSPGKGEATGGPRPGSEVPGAELPESPSPEQAMAMMPTERGTETARIVIPPSREDGGSHPSSEIAATGSDANADDHSDGADGASDTAATGSSESGGMAKSFGSILMAPMTPSSAASAASHGTPTTTAPSTATGSGTATETIATTTPEAEAPEGSREVVAREPAPTRRPTAAPAPTPASRPSEPAPRTEPAPTPESSSPTASAPTVLTTPLQCRSAAILTGARGGPIAVIPCDSGERAALLVGTPEGRYAACTLAQPIHRVWAVSLDTGETRDDLLRVDDSGAAIIRGAFAPLARLVQDSGVTLTEAARLRPAGACEDLWRVEPLLPRGQQLADGDIIDVADLDRNSRDEIIALVQEREAILLSVIGWGEQALERHTVTLAELSLRSVPALSAVPDAEAWRILLKEGGESERLWACGMLRERLICQGHSERQDPAFFLQPSAKPQFLNPEGQVLTLETTPSLTATMSGLFSAGDQLGLAPAEVIVGAPTIVRGAAAAALLTTQRQRDGSLRYSRELVACPADADVLAAFVPAALPDGRGYFQVCRTREQSFLAWRSPATAEIPVESVPTRTRTETQR